MSSSRFDPQPPDRAEFSHTNRQEGVADNVASGEVENAREVSDEKLLALIGQFDRLSRDYHSQTVERPLARAYRSWQNKHAEGSKYLGTAFRGRSRLFVPKTRAAVRKNMAGAAAALFSTDDVVNLTASYEDDDEQRAIAAVLKADLDYRMTRTTVKSGMPWYLIAMGGCLDSQLTGVTISKQFWEYEEVPTGEYEQVKELLQDEETGEIVLDEFGEPVIVDGVKEIMRVVKDRPMSELHPIENAGVDPAAPWYSPIQLGRCFVMRYAMGLSDAKALMQSRGKGEHSQAWLDVSDDVLLKGRVEQDRSGSRRVREGGSDRYEGGKAPGELEIIWIQENFIRISGVDYHFWSVGRHEMLSEVRETIESYPEFGGERPYTFGMAQIDTHRVFPQSPVETWAPLQLELNDIANLRLDTLKRSIAPLAVVRRGRNVDLTQVQRRGQPDAMLLVDDPADVDFRPTPGPNGQAYTETSITNSNFDELAGVFSTSSVQQSRQLNETVGGMRMMSGAANSVSEFDLRTWVETWVEPTVRQLAHLVRYHESDEKILAIAGSKARVMQEFGRMPALQDFERAELSVRVNVGIGSADPMMRLGKLKSAFEMLAPFMEEMKKQGIELDVGQIIDEVMGSAGFKDGRRFFKFGDPVQPQPDADVIKLMEEMKLEREKMQMGFKEFVLDMRSEEQRAAADNATKLQVEDKKTDRELKKQVIGAAISRDERRSDAEREHKKRLVEIFSGRKPTSITPTAAPHGSDVTAPMPMRQPPPRHDTNQLMAKITDAIALLATQSVKIEQSLNDVSNKVGAPAEIVRNPATGQALGVRKAGRFQHIQRNPDGTINGTVAMETNPAPQTRLEDLT